MLLASAMVFFRDMQFLWGVLSMIWMYLTPVFYPESIIPAQFMTVYKMNPLYQVDSLFPRIALMDGVSPEPKAYLLMLLASFIPLLIGALVFKKNAGPLCPEPVTGKNMSVMIPGRKYFHAVSYGL